MIDPTDQDIGRGVIYRPMRIRAKPECGVITSFNAAFVFVRYDGDGESQATRRQDLYWAKQ